MEINFITFLSYTRFTQLKNWRCLKNIARPWRFRRRKIMERKFSCDSPPCRFAVSLKIIASTLRMYTLLRLYQIKINSFHSRRYRVSLKERKVRNVLLFLLRLAQDEISFVYPNRETLKSNCIRIETQAGWLHRQDEKEQGNSKRAS